MADTLTTVPEIVTTVPEITAINEPLLSSPTQSSTPVLSTAGHRTAIRAVVTMLLGLFSGRRDASMLVRRNVEIQMQYWQADWGYSLPVVVIDTLWNLAFVAVSVATLFWIAREETNVRLRIWICVYSMQSVVHVVLSLMEYRRRNMRNSTVPSLASDESSSTEPSSFEDDLDREFRLIRWDKHNTLLANMWWAIGFYLLLGFHRNDERLVWLTLSFLATDVFFFTLRCIFSCLLSLGYYFCLPCIIAFMYFTRCQNRASDVDINILPIYNFQVSNGDMEQPGDRACIMVPMGTNGPNHAVERVLPPEDAECCICLCHYEEGEPLVLLPCNHEFHSPCIEIWLRIIATCPICNSHVT